MQMTQKIIVAISCFAVIPFLVTCYLFTNGSSSFLTTKSLIIFITLFISILGGIGIHNLIVTLKKIYLSLNKIASGEIDQKAMEGTSSGISDLATSINQVSQRLRDSADELERRTICIARFNRELKRRDDFASEYFSNIVHELRAPLINIEKSSILLLENKVDAIIGDRDKFLRTINENANRMIRLISDLLDISKMESGQLLIKREPICVKKTIEEAVNAVEGWGKSKNLRLETRIEENIPGICADKYRVIQVVVNLLSNAIKFTPSGGKITVEAKMFKEKLLKEDNGDRGFIEISIQDAGIGITAEKKDQIFERYQAGPGLSFDAVPNTGLGLPIAKQIVQMHGGKIWVASRPGKGTRIAFTLPEESEKIDERAEPSALEYRIGIS